MIRWNPWNHVWKFGSPNQSLKLIKSKNPIRTSIASKLPCGPIGLCGLTKLYVNWYESLQKQCVRLILFTFASHNPNSWPLMSKQCKTTFKALLWLDHIWYVFPVSLIHIFWSPICYTINTCHHYWIFYKILNQEDI